MTSLLDPRDGFAAEDVRRAVGLSAVARVEELERRCERLERVLSVVLETFRGFDIEGGSAYVSPEPRTGLIRLHSIDGTIDITDEPTGATHGVNIEIGTYTPPLPCFVPCAAPVTNPFSGTENTKWAGFLRVCRDGDPDRCVAVPYVECDDVGGCT